MKEKYYLKNSYGYIIGIFDVVDSDKHHVDGSCYQVTGWLCSNDNKPCDFTYVAGIYAKWDACTHWYFDGEDCLPNIYDTRDESEKEKDAYYHICSDRGFVEHIRLMCFVWKVVSQIIGEKRGKPDDINSNYFGMGITSELVELMLKDFEIVKMED